MKKIHLLALILLAGLTGCKKDSDEEYYLAFTVNGTNKKYTGYTLGHTEPSGAYSELTILGATSALSFDDYLGIYLNNFPGAGSFTTGEYTDASANFTLLATYENGGMAYEAGQSVAEDAVTYNVPIANHFKINITQINGETIRGTFSGDFYEDGDVQTGTKISITNGTFYVKVQ